MDLIVPIPDDIVPRLNADRAGLERRALEAMVAEEYRLGHLHKPDLRRLLGFQTRDEINEFLRIHDIDESFTVQEIEHQVDTLERLGV